MQNRGEGAVAKAGREPNAPATVRGLYTDGKKRRALAGRSLARLKSGHYINGEKSKELLAGTLARRSKDRRYVTAKYSRQVGEEGDVEFGIVLFHVAGAVLGAEFFDHGRHLFGVRDRSDLPISLCATGRDLDGRVLLHVLVPLCIGAGDGQEVELVVFRDEPDWDGDGTS
jgi:hypothetical protein